MEEVIEKELGPDDTLYGMAITSGSAGTLACGDYLKRLFPAMKIAAGEALQCPTMMENGFGVHRIEGIGDKHVPWIHNVKNTDTVIAVDDEAVMSLARLFNEKEGRRLLVERDVPQVAVENLDLLGFSGIANLIMAIKLAKYYELGANDLVLTVLTDSMDLYGSRLQEMAGEHGEYSQLDAAADYARHLQGITTDNLEELRFTDRRRIHNLKYFTWVEQQGKSAGELVAQWSDTDYWRDIQGQAEEIDALIEEFNHR